MSSPFCRERDLSAHAPSDRKNDERLTFSLCVPSKACILQATRTNSGQFRTDDDFFPRDQASETSGGASSAGYGVVGMLRVLRGVVFGQR